MHYPKENELNSLVLKSKDQGMEHSLVESKHLKFFQLYLLKTKEKVFFENSVISHIKQPISRKKVSFFRSLYNNHCLYHFLTSQRLNEYLIVYFLIALELNLMADDIMNIVPCWSPKGLRKFEGKII